MSLLVAKKKSVIANATIMISVAHISGLIPKPFQFSETKKTALNPNQTFLLPLLHFAKIFTISIGEERCYISV